MPWTTSVPRWHLAGRLAREDIDLIFLGTAFAASIRLPAREMRLTLLESNRSFLQVAECACLSVLVHLALIWFAVSASQGGRQLPANEREARVFFLLPPDRVDVRSRQPDIIQWGKLGTDLRDGKLLSGPDAGWVFRERARPARRRGHRSGA